MKKQLLLTALGLLSCIHLNAQNVTPDEGQKLGSATKSEAYTLECLGETNTPTTDIKWMPILITKCTSRRPKSPEEAEIEKIKAEKLVLRQENMTKVPGNESSTKNVPPVVGSNWLGNVNNGSSPMDNSVAISDAGIIVSVSNTTIEVDNSSGNTLYYNNLAAFFNDPGITNTCDPVVLYDKGADRFILFFQECSGSSSNSYACICFSQTNNPGTGGWWKYKFNGDPTGSNTWFDYPKMAISNNELYLSGNLFTNGGSFSQSVLFQIEKTLGYSGGSIGWQYWSNINGNPFTLLPVSHGQGGSYGPGCYLVATSSGGSALVKLYHLTDDMASPNEQLNYYSVATTPYSPAADASQAGTSCQLDNGDCRALSGFYLNGIIHFVFHSDIGASWNGINYNRLTVGTLTNQSSTFGLQGTYDYSYPSVASYATSSSDKSVMIGFGRSGSSIAPEVRVVNCDNSMNWSSSTLVKASSGYVSYTSSTKERWGDYTGMSRKHNSATPSVWMNGMFGNSSNRWDTWIAEIHDNGVGLAENQAQSGLTVYPNPVVETFTLEFDLANEVDLEITVVDMAGKLIKELYQGIGHAGANAFSFNKANLSPGTYYLMIKDTNNILKNEKIIVSN